MDMLKKRFCIGNSSLLLDLQFITRPDHCEFDQNENPLVQFMPN